MEKSIGRADYRRFLSALRDIRLEAGISQGELARRIDVTPSFVSKYESGVFRLDFVQLDTITRALGSSLEELVGRYRSEQSTPPNP